MTMSLAPSFPLRVASDGLRTTKQLTDECELASEAVAAVDEMDAILRVMRISASVRLPDQTNRRSTEFRPSGH